MRIRQLVTLTLMLAVLGGCKAGEKTIEGAVELPATPEEVIHQVHAACLEGRYEVLLSLFSDGGTMWESDPAFFKARVDRVCQDQLGGVAEYLEIREGQVNGEGAFYKTFSYPSEAEKVGGRYGEWQLLKESEGWVIVSLLN